MKIAVDAMGGDNAPEAVVCGAVRAAQNYHEEIILVGQEDKIRRRRRRITLRTPLVLPSCTHPIWET